MPTGNTISECQNNVTSVSFKNRYMLHAFYGALARITFGGSRTGLKLKILIQ
jgi:hypothetical protein